LTWSTSYGNGIAIGSAVSSSKQWSVGNAIRDNISGSEFATSYYDQNNVLVTVDDDDVDTIEAAASLVSLGTGNFVINWTNASPTHDRAFSVLVVDADPGSIDVGTFTEPASTGTQVVNVSSTADSIRGVMIYSNGFSSSGINHDALMSIGGASGTGATDQGVVSTGDEDTAGEGNTISSRINKTGSIIKTILPADTATSSTTTSEAALSAMGTQDQFSLNWTTRSGTRRNHYIVFGT
jgi:glycine cleavage system regulatory protein